MAKKTRSAEFEEIGRSAQELVLKSYGELYNLRRQMWVSFVKGVFAGLGGVIGATVMVGVLLFLLRYFGDLPVVGRFFENISNIIKSYTPGP